MLAVALCLQVAFSDSVYSSPALRQLIAIAATENRNIPTAVRAYYAAVESEVAIGVRQARGIEAPVSLEQLSSRVEWRRPGTFVQHVVGERVEAIGPQLSALSFLRQSLLVPHLYGNEIQLLFGRDSTGRRADRARPRRQVTAIHPLAAGRERYYRYSGGDTVVTMRIDGRSIPVVRVLVEPRSVLPQHTVVFAGELSLDVTRGHVVRMRGRFSTTDDATSFLGRAIGATLESVLYVELDNLEVERQVWLPATQRFEAQILFRIASDTRSIFRVTSRFRDYRLTLDPSRTPLASDSLEPRPHRLTLAGGDSLGRFTYWRQPLGTASPNATSEDFDDLAPAGWRPTGWPVLRVQAARLAELVHINRVEGWYTGLAAELLARDAAPGLRIHANAGWAWMEREARGHALVTWDRGRTRTGLHAGRTLDMTNDFRPPLDSGSTLGAALGVDDYDYVARDIAGVTVSHAFGLRQQLLSGIEVALVHDGSATVHMKRSPLGFGADFRANRGITAGSYRRTTITMELNPAVGVGFVQPGFGAKALAQVGTGGLKYERVEARAIARWNGAQMTTVVRVDAGLLTGSRIPAQELFEVGSAQNLIGYGYKEFAGNRAVVGRALAMRRLPVLRTPLRIGSRFILPGLSPAVSLSGQTAWVGARGAGAMGALVDLSGSVPVEGSAIDLCRADAADHGLISRPTCGWRSAIGVGLRVFGGAIGLTLARPIDHRGRWRLQFDVGQIL
ncbi:MAG: hypothetical protein MNPFHGCM_00106 [Gemmatimonadaceae bacterium]|nr:hypothetical protein [Gemmatimonadaceae bacterium]